MIKFFMHSNFEGKLILVWMVINIACLVIGFFNKSFLIAGFIILVCSFFTFGMFLPEAQFGKDDPPDENALL